jgi:hypothetical protein
LRVTRGYRKTEYLEGSITGFDARWTAKVRRCRGS